MVNKVDWAEHFKRASFVSSFGTIDGLMSVAELKDYVAAKDFAMQHLGQSYADFSPTWVNEDSAAFIDWTNDWNDLQNRYNAARADAESAISVASYLPLSDANTPADPPYREITLALKQVPGQITKGDLQDLAARLQSAGGTLTTIPAPQPRANTDADLTAMNTLAPVDALAGTASTSVYTTIGIIALLVLAVIAVPVLAPIVATAIAVK